MPLDRAIALVDDAVTRGVFPGATLVVGDGGETVLRRAFGTLAGGDSPSVTLDTVYDVASVTKAAVTALLALRLVQAGRLALDTPAAAYLRSLAGGGKERIRVRDLLAHASGLPAWRPFYEGLAADAPREALVALCAGEPLEAPVGARSVYSDLGFIILGAVVEGAGGARLDELAQRALFAPLDLRRSTFVDLRVPGPRPSPVAPTEICPRRGLVSGEVHDDNCHAAGGICGHAGLFSTADDLGRLSQVLLASWHGRDVPGGFPPELVRQFFAPAGVPGSSWRLGWDGPAPTGSRIGDLWPRTGVLHLGFTGCSVVLDLDRERWVVLCSNRVHPSRADERIRDLRPALHDAIVEGLH